MTSEFNKRGKLFPDLSDIITHRDVRKLAGISEGTLRRWTKKGLLTPEITVHGQRRVVFNQRQLARAILIKQLRKSDWNFPEIRGELCEPGCLSRNMDEIRSIILENRQADEASS